MRKTVRVRGGTAPMVPCLHLSSRRFCAIIKLSILFQYLTLVHAFASSPLVLVTRVRSVFLPAWASHRRSLPHRSQSTTAAVFQEAGGRRLLTFRIFVVCDKD